MSIPEDLSEKGKPEREEGKLSEVEELSYAFRRFNADIELDVDLVIEENDDCIGLELKLQE